ncbi:type I polyketide synthase [Nocardia sp. BMG51109]|uniref:type I polyketide synthase n=1 Tax=Nocardia sp. BMG51109 TaxID=1056816 RepID=UPI000464175B|nr:type I polyketide synthase [Nocardia sp. BMG51109]
MTNDESELTLAHLLRSRAEAHPDRDVFSYLPDGETVAERWTYGELHERALGVASWLTGSGAAGERVLVMHSNPLHFVAAIFGCAYSGAVAVPAYSPVGKRQKFRIAKIVSDSGAGFALSSADALDRDRSGIESTEAAPAMSWCASDILPATAEHRPAGDPRPDDLMVLQYTSGSTGDPKGVMMTHRNFVHNLGSIRAAYGDLDETDGLSAVFWLPLHHDMGLVGAVLGTIQSGYGGELMSPISFVQRPIRWLRRISGKRALVTTAPNFAYDLCVDTTTPEERAELDLSGWRVAMCGAEAVRPDTMRRFAEAFAPAGFRASALQPVYGLAEGTLLVTGSPRADGPLRKTLRRSALSEGEAVEAAETDADAVTMVGCGRPQEGTRVVVADPDTFERCPDGTVGEVWVASDAVARGYWGQPEASARTFGARLSTPGGEPSGPYLRTGDLGFVGEGELFVAGRLKDLIIIRGRNLYPDDIENTVQESDPILLRGRGAAFSVPGSVDERLVIVQEVERDRTDELDADTVCRAIATAVAQEHEVAVSQIVLVRAYSLPSTTSGKVQRFACREKLGDDSLKVLGEWSGQATAAPADRAAEAAAAPATTVSARELEDWMVDHLSREFRLPASDIDTGQLFAYYGLDSVRGIKLVGALGEHLGTEIAPALIYEHPTIADLARALTEDSPSAEVAAEPQAGGGAETGEPIAIVGIGCRFPGADGTEAFWDLLTTGVDAVTAVPVDRWEHREVRWGGFLDDVRGFDAEFFGISPREAKHIDPQQRLMLEVVWEALADAGLDVERLAGTDVGVFVGISSNDYGRTFYRSEDRIEAYSGTGNAVSVAANRVSYLFDFRGPSVAVDTACSSSLVAVHDACRSLRTGESTLAVAGGVNVMLSPDLGINMARAGVVAPDGRCKTFDTSADGYVRGEGAAVVALEPLSRAMAEGHPVYAVIRGSAVNQDGRTNGLMAPNGRSQRAVLARAYADAGIAPGDVGYVEAHGTGTSIGDAIETGALAAVLGAGRDPGNPCVIGSVKTNIGHLEAAAGIAGTIKAALALHHRTLPPSLHYRQPNPAIDLATLRVCDRLEEWPDPGPVGVSSFGFGGTNSHAVLTAAPRQPGVERRPREGARDHAILPISAQSPEALRELARRYVDVLTDTGEDAPDWSSLTYSAAVRSTHLDERLTVVAKSKDEAAEQLSAYLNGAARTGTAVGRRPGRTPRIGFVFSGQGSQWQGMGKQLFTREPAFRAALTACDREIRRNTGWSVIDELHADAERSRLDEIDVLQPTLFAIQVALAAWWRSVGVVPDAVTGHSMGEVAAAHVAGALELPDAAAVICERARLLRTLSGRGAMAVVELPADRLAPRLAEFGAGIGIAAVNSPGATVLSGDAEAVRAALEQFEREDVFCRAIKSDVAGHSPHMDELRPALEADLSGIRPRTGTVPIYSTVTGEIHDGGELSAGYWGRNLRETVQFEAAVGGMVDDGYDLLLEVSPHPVLTAALIDIRDTRRPAPGGSVTATTIVESMRRDTDEQAELLASVGELYCAGYPVQWQLQYPHGGHFVRPPRYPWQREIHWITDDLTAPSGAARGELVRLDSAIHAGTAFWQTEVSLDTMPGLADHRVRSVPVVPAALYVALACTAARQLFGGTGCEVADFEFTTALTLEPGTARPVQLAVLDRSGDSASVRILAADRSVADSPWERLSDGVIRALDTSGGSAAGSGVARGSAVQGARAAGRARNGHGPADMAAGGADGRAAAEGMTGDGVAGGVVGGDDVPADGVSARGDSVAGRGRPQADSHDSSVSVPAAEFYRTLAEAGLEYGPAFRRIVEIRRCGADAVASLAPISTGSELADTMIRLDAAFQTLAATVDSADTLAGSIYLPVGLDRLRIRGDLTAAAECHMVNRGISEAGLLEGDFEIVAEDGTVLADGAGLRVRCLAEQLQREAEGPRNWFHAVRWDPAPLPAESPRAAGPWLIVGAGGAADELRERLAAAGCAVSVCDRETNLYDVLAADDEVAGVVYLATGPATESALPDIPASVRESILEFLGRAQDLARYDWPARPPRLYLVTRGTQDLPPGAALDEQTCLDAAVTAPTWGLARTIEHEYPELRCTRVDMSPAPDDREYDALVGELTADNPETELALRADQRFVARIAPVAEPEPVVRPAEPDEGYVVRQAAPGLLDALRLQRVARREPGPGEVEIRVRAAGLNFHDVVEALGVIPPENGSHAVLGAECAGTVVAVGAGVEGIAPGDVVAAIAMPAFGSYVTTAAELVVPVPDGISPADAATIPVAFLTAHRALCELARLEPGERVLIHAATGGVGLAAIQIARRIGAEIYATAGSEEKRNHLRRMGIEHVMDSRSLAFAREIVDATGGTGVDVVLNSLSGEAVSRSLALLRPFGRFVEIGKRDIHERRTLDLWLLRQNVSHFTVDLTATAWQRPDRVAAALRTIMGHVEAGEYAPLPVTVFDLGEAQAAFEHMARARHIGKVVLVAAGAAPDIHITEPRLHADGTYLITGGLGGIGIELARWSVERGARHLVLVGRRAPNAHAATVIEQLRAAGTEVSVRHVDVGRADQVGELVASIGRAGPPLRGILHVAGTLADGLIEHLDEAAVDTVLAAKAAGAWNLHVATAGRTLEFVVYFSSAAGTLGAPGQANYAAANVFLDALARYRRAAGLPATSIAWGPWGEIGLAVRDDRSAHVRSMGIGMIEPAAGLAALDRVLPADPVQSMVLPTTGTGSADLSDIPRLRELTPAASESASPQADGDVAAALAQAEPGARPGMVADYLIAVVARRLGMDADAIETDRPLRYLGLDSLGAMELRTRIQRDLAVTIPLVKLLEGPSIAEFTAWLLGQLDTGTPASATRAAAAPAATDKPAQARHLLDRLDTLPDDDVDRLLSDLLASEGDKAS